eukprot:gene18137-19947_t
MNNQVLSLANKLIMRSVCRYSYKRQLTGTSGCFYRCLSSLTKINLGNGNGGGGGPILDFPDMGPPIPEQKDRSNESLQEKRARLLYQSRKRGISENGLLLSTFASKYLNTFDENLLNEYDFMINKPSNDWELFYWMTGKKPAPPEFDNEIMKMLKEHTKNEKMETRYQMPNLNEKNIDTKN